MRQGPGLRERKKVKNRELIADAARRLFLERGFENVTVADVASEAEVSEKTVFNYFPTKEDLFYARMETFEEDLLAAIRARGPGESVLAAFGRFVLQRRGLLAERDPAAVERLAAITWMITQSPALLARERQLFDRYTAALASLLAEEKSTPVQVEHRVVAGALIGVHRALVDYTRERILAGVRNPRLSRDVRRQGVRTLRVLEDGLGTYGIK
jgi:AcrR family transcriptional regulator